MGGAGGGMATHTGVGTTELSTGWNSFTYTYQDISGSNTDVASVLAKGYSQNFFQFTTVTGGSTGSVSEHMESFWYSYELNAIYEWLMQQTL